MNSTDYYNASVPVFVHYLNQMAEILARDDLTPDMLGHRLAPDMPAAAAQFATAVNFSLRICLKLAGKKGSAVPQIEQDRDSLLDWVHGARKKLAALTVDDYADAGREISHRAGVAFLTQSAQDYLFKFGLPNFFFHMSMAYANLRAAGLPLGKADFDGLHDYPKDFRL